MSACRASRTLLLGLLLAVGCVDPDADPSAVALAPTGPDLITSALDDPPTDAVVGDTFSLMDTVQNVGTADAAASFSKYYLSSNGTTAQFLLGNRAVGALTVGASDTGMASLKIPVNTHGVYFVLACADRGPGTGGGMSQVPEADESNNCRTSTGTVNITAPDLVETSVSVTPPTVDALTGTMTVTDTVTNVGDAAAAASITRWYLSTDAVKDAGDAAVRNCINGGVTPGRNVAAIMTGSDSGSASATPLCVRDATGLHAPAVGSYFVIACADATNEVGESNETNQCTASSNTILVTQCGNGTIETGETCDDGNTNSGDGCNSTCQIEGNADLTASAVSNPPAVAAIGDSFSVTDSVTNISTNGAPSSTTFYYLSTDTTKSSSDRQLTGARAVPALNGGQTSSGTVSVTVPPGFTAGSYYLLACADGPGTVAETSETNNCIASSTTVGIVGPDLTVTALGNPPATANVGQSFNLTDTTANIGVAAAGQSYTKFYLSRNGSFLDWYLGTRTVAGLAGGASSSATTSVQVRTGTASGTYFVVACADSGPSTTGRTSEIDEVDETNNCRASTGTVQIGSPDLVITAINNPPATGSVGMTFPIADTTANVGQGDAGAFFNKYYLSANGTTPLYYVGTGSAAPLPAGQNEPVTTTGTIRSGTPAGTYFLLGCADRGPGTGGGVSQVPESNEKNNCRPSTAQITLN